MSYRHLFISEPAQLVVEHGQLCVKNELTTYRVPLEDLSTVMIDSKFVTLTSTVLQSLGEHHIVLFGCDAKHLPNGCYMGFNGHSRQLNVMKQQLVLSRPFMKRIWQAIIKQKIENQADCLAQYEKSGVQKLRALANKVESGDRTYKESEASRLYFPALFGAGFVRRDEDIRNAALNYSYAIVRGMVARTIVAYGFMPALGIFHHSEQNNYNLADDFMEPFRPIIDAFVYRLELDDTLTPVVKKKLYSIVAEQVWLNEQCVTLNLAVNNMIKSYVSCIKNDDYTLLHLPSFVT